jgi:CheY-like chemotaxis protein
MTTGTEADSLARRSAVHDLKTALSMIVGFAELLEARDDPQTRIEAARGILEGAERLRSLVESITGLPLADEAVAPDEPAAARRNAARRQRLLVIADDPAEVDLLRAAFPTDAYDLLDVGDASEAFEVLDEAQPHLVVLDWTLSGGAEILAELKLRHPDLPVIVLADDGDPRQRRIATLLDAEAFLPRPFDPQRLLGLATALAAD